MKNKILRMVGACGLAAALALPLTGCAGQQAASGEGPDVPRQETDQEIASPETTERDLEFSKRDLDPSYDEAAATKITLSDAGIQVQGDGATADGSVVTLGAEGTYILSGTLTNGHIAVEAGDEDKLQVVFDNVSVTNPTGPAFIVENADKCFITLAEGSDNRLGDGADYALEGEDDNRDAALFSRDDLTINGPGALTVEGVYKHAICSNDDLVITGGVLNVTSKEDALRGKDCIKIADGALTVNAGDDAFHSDAYVYAKDGTITVESCYEGYEGEQVIIDGGIHQIKATDDALNAALSDSGSSSQELPGSTAAAQDEGAAKGFAPEGMAQSSSSCLIQINGGALTLVAGNDGIDSNGNVEINGGMVLVAGPESGMDGSLDYDLSATINGGTVLMLGSVGSTRGLSESDQAVTYASVQGFVGQEVALVDGSGAVLAAFEAPTDFAHVLASCPDVESGQSFTVTVGGISTELTAGSGLDMAQNEARDPAGVMDQNGAPGQGGAPGQNGAPDQNGASGQGGMPGRERGPEGMKEAPAA